MIERLARLIARHLWGHLDPQFHELKRRMKSMSDSVASVDQRLADLTALAEKERDDNARFRADVVTALAAMTGNGPLVLNAAQQAAFDNLTAIITQTDQATNDADAALPKA